MAGSPQNGAGRVEESAFGITTESGFVDATLISEPVPGHSIEDLRQPVVCPAGSVAFIHMDR